MAGANSAGFFDVSERFETLLSDVGGADSINLSDNHHTELEPGCLTSESIKFKEVDVPFSPGVTCFLCLSCNIKFESLPVFNRHKNICLDLRDGSVCSFLKDRVISVSKDQFIHERVSPYICDYCSSSIQSANAFRSHVLSCLKKPREANLDWFKFRVCFVCVTRYSKFKLFSSDLSFLNHIANIHTNPYRIAQHIETFGSLPKTIYRSSCPYCFKTCCDFVSLNNHCLFCSYTSAISAQASLFQCSICAENTASMPALVSHLQTHDITYNCPICKSRVFSFESMALHSVTCSKDVLTESRGCCRICHGTMECSSLEVYMCHLILHLTRFKYCNNCGDAFLSDDLFNVHASHCRFLPHKRKTYTCEECDKTFLSNDSLKTHKTASHTSIRFKCDDCKKIFKRKSTLRDHSCRKRSLSCSHCNQQFYSHRTLVDHLTVHNTDKSMSLRSKFPEFSRNSDSTICPICNLKLSSKRNVVRHMKRHREKQQNCEICGKKFVLPQELRGHMLSHQRNIESIACPVCKKDFKVKDSLYKHLRKFHCRTPLSNRTERSGGAINTKSNLLMCKNCNLIFVRAIDMVNHQRALHADISEKLKACEKCDLIFQSNDQYQDHLKLNHSEPAFVCKLCNDPFKYRDSLRRHLKRRHPDEADNNT